MANLPKARAFMLALTTDHTNFATLLKQCKNLPTDYQWALITHDKDDGGNHYHVAIKTLNPLAPQTIANKFNTKQNFVQLWRGSTDNLWGYLAHNTATAHNEKADYNEYITNPEKFATNLPDIKLFTNNPHKTKNNIKLQNYIREILAGNITLKDLLKTDNLEYYHDNYNKLQRAIQLRTQSLRYNPPTCKTIYITGNSGTGKTTYAHKLATEKYGDNWAMASGKNDPLQDYTGEKCLIIDDFRPQDYDLNQLLAMLDPYYRQRTHQSRYYNKPLATELIIITTSNTLDDTIRHYTDFNKEDPKQIRRRLQTVITMQDDQTPYIEHYDEQLDGYIYPLMDKMA